MTRFTIASFNVKNLIEPDQEYYRFEEYTPEEYRGEDGPAKVGWGHSTYEAAADLARAAGVGQLLLFHHDLCVEQSFPILYLEGVGLNPDIPDAGKRELVDHPPTEIGDPKRHRTR